MHLIEYQNAAGQDLAPIWASVASLFPPQLLEGELGTFLSLQLSVLYIEMGDAELRLERDPRPRLQRAMELLERSRGRTAERFLFNIRHANAHLIWGQYLQQQGQDPTAQADAAIEAYRAAALANPTRFDPPWGLAEVSLVKARHILRVGGNPTIDLADGREALEALGRQAPSNWASHGGWAESLLLEAEWHLRQRLAPGPLLERALVHARKALALNSRRPELWTLVAKVHRFRLERLHGAPAERNRALAALGKALASDSRHREALKERAALMSGLPSDQPPKR
jgi:tetratricopeptide (TPR) repeat protein